MLDVVTELRRVSCGPVIIVAAGVTRDRNYWPGCEGLMWEWWKRGGECQLYRPCFYHRVGIPGSGGDDWFRADTEYVMCFKGPGPLPFSDNTAMGHSPKWEPGGAMSYRVSNGTRVNQLVKEDNRQANGQMKTFPVAKRHHTKSRADGSDEVQEYHPPTLANPGNLIHCVVGGGNLGSAMSSRNEAPMPERLAEWFIRSCCPPNGIVLDPFSGSGTTAAVAKRCRRRYLALDIRMSQVQLARLRIEGVTTELFA